MTCILFNGNSRQCENKFKLLTKDVSMDFCNSDEYSQCPFYKIIVEKRSYCEDIEDCGYRLHRLKSTIRHDVDTYKKIKHLVFDYCLSEKNINCARYQLKKEGKFVPYILLQDGSFLKTTDFLEDITH